MQIDHGDFKGWASGRAAIEGLTQVLREQEKTRRLLIGAACLLFCVSALVMIFAPPGKQELAYALGAVLLVIALGAIGVAKFKLKAPGVEIDAARTMGEIQNRAKTR